MKKHYKIILLCKYTLCLLVCLAFEHILPAQTQTQTKITKVIYREYVTDSLTIGGYLESLPVSYATDSTRKFPMIIFLHGKGGLGNGSQTALGKLENDASGSIPYKIKNGTFPTSVTVDGQTFSFIVISPQFTRESGVSAAAATKAMIDTAIKYYRVDTNRIYITGLSLGGSWANAFIAAGQAAYTNQTAASILICPSAIAPGPFTTRSARVGSSNLPLWILSNYGDASTNRTYLKLYIDTLNLYSPQLMPKAKLNILDSSNLTPSPHHDAWTEAYNQANTWDGLNVYQWMLQFTNKKLTANAGPDQSVATSTVTLNGAKSKVRQGRITGYLWTKLSGPSCTITNSTDSITTVTGLSAGTYNFELKVTHTNASTARDTVQIVVAGAAQTLNKISKVIFREYSDNSVSVGGYLESLPASYNTDSTRQFPMIVFAHDDKSFGTGSSADLDKITDSASGTIPNLIKDGTFPTSVTVDGKTYSFIVVCPQFKSVSGISLGACIKAMIDTAIKYYRVDTSRIYVTGAGWGGYAAKAFIANTSPSYINYIHQTAAAALICPLYTETGSLTKAANQVGASNLPIRFFRNSADPHPYANISALQLFIDTLNLYRPQLTDTARLTVFTASNHDAWTAAYNPANTWDSLNLYQWMLQYTNQKLTANAGVDQSVATNTVTLNGTRSRARQGRITGYLWTKLSGPSCSITHSTDSITTATGLSNGTYSFELKVTHANGSTARDTMQVVVAGLAQSLNKISKVIFREYSDNSISVGGYLESLPVFYSTDSTRKFPMIVVVHNEKAWGTGSAADLDRITDSASGTIPNLIKDGTFPTSVTVDGKTYSFIVVCPQFDRGEGGISLAACIKAMIDTAIQHYRVDTSRIYVTGASWGGYAAKAFVATTSSSYINYIHQTAAAALICPLYTETGSLTKAANQVGASNLPIWFFRNSADPHPYANISTLQLFIDTLNLYRPKLTDTARLTVFTASSHDAWTAAYNPANTWNGLNLYQWMLQHTNQKLVANAGADQSVAANSTTLDATGSRARQGRISGYLWTKLSGPSCTITHSTDSITTVTGMSDGTYSFELKVTHTNSSTARDTVVVTVNSGSPRKSNITEDAAAGNISAQPAPLEVKAVPNPAGSDISIIINGNVKGKTSVTIYNVLGERMLQQQFRKEDAGTINRNINISSLAAGIYIVEIAIDNEIRKTVKIVKH